MKFEKYNSLTNAYNLKDMIEFEVEVPIRHQWVVTEKIHGSNFQFKSTRPICGEEWHFIVGKRTGFTDTDFFKLESSEEFMNQMEGVKVAMKHIYYTRPEVKTIEIDGEVFGGNIQKGIFYSRSKRFIAFDIKINNVFVDHKEFVSICQEYNILRVPILFVGHLSECKKVSNAFNSLLPNILGEDMPEGDNICEGIVTKPTTTYFLNNGTRVAIKDKNDIWSEKASMKKKSQADPLLGNDRKIYELLSEMIDENRVESAISKIGSEMKYIPKLLQEVQEDIIKSVSEPIYEPYLKDITIDITLDNTNKIRRLLSKRIVSLIKKSIQGRL